MPHLEFAILLLLIMVANGAPILATRVLGERLATPLDMGLRLPDGYPLFGNAKTLRGLAVSALVTPIAAMVCQRHWLEGLAIAVAAMLGDLLASFLKRRMGLAPHSMALGLDQVPECLFPAVLLMGRFGLGWLDVALLVAAFAVLELLLSRLLYLMKVRDRPY